MFALIANSFAAEVNVMMPLNTINLDGSVRDMNYVKNAMTKMKDAGVHGIIIDVWWGIAEPQPNVYKFDGYLQVFEMARSLGLKMEPIMSFHKCGGNVGDSVTIPIPKWVLEVATPKKLFYADQWGTMADEYISAAANYEKVFPSKSGDLRTPLTMYNDYMRAFRSAAVQFFNDKTIDQVQIGLGPCGELRYPSYPLSRWSYPGVGAFQAFDPLMVKMFQEKAKAAGYDYQSPPTDAGTYNSRPEQTQFFTTTYKSTYGMFFMTFYQGLLLEHAQDILEISREVFSGTPLTSKVSGIHWWYGHDSHAAELTAGYYNVLSMGKNAYEQIEAVFGDVQFDFTCMEMTDQGHAGENCNSKPEELVRQCVDAVKQHAGTMSGENALETYSSQSYDQILNQLRYGKGYLNQFAYMRQTDQLIYNDGFYNQFKDFVAKAKNI
ncbi:Beta-amylase [Hexamita inflata]|uniref:Beta-amylase n=1 Tax=Hexamita inflata TaxID=28002 RepID=A0AA86QY73_9EUKA|nr:Beta-amylase [Hexamita inflata]